MSVVKRALSVIVDAHIACANALVESLIDMGDHLRCLLRELGPIWIVYFFWATVLFVSVMAAYILKLAGG